MFLYITNLLTRSPHSNLNNILTSFSSDILFCAANSIIAPNHPSSNILPQVAATASFPTGLLLTNTFPLNPHPVPTQDLTLLNGYNNALLLCLGYSTPCWIATPVSLPCHSQNSLLPHPAWAPTPYTRLSLAFKPPHARFFSEKIQAFEHPPF